MKRKLIIYILLFILSLQVLPFRNIDLMFNDHQNREDQTDVLFFPDEEESKADGESEGKEAEEGLSKIIKIELINDHHFFSLLSQNIQIKRMLLQKIGDPLDFYSKLIIPPPNRML
jgi:hypothetical protein